MLMVRRVEIKLSRVEVEGRNYLNIETSRRLAHSFISNCYRINVLAEDIHKAYVMSLFQGGLAGLLWQGIELSELPSCFLASVVWRASRREPPPLWWTCPGRPG